MGPLFCSTPMPCPPVHGYYFFFYPTIFIQRQTQWFQQASELHSERQFVQLYLRSCRDIGENFSLQVLCRCDFERPGDGPEFITFVEQRIPHKGWFEAKCVLA